MQENKRQPAAEVDSLLLNRWSPRAFDGRLLSDRQVYSLLEAARWSPSCYNEQPWQFACANTKTDIEMFSQALVSVNRQWAPKAGLLMFIIYRRDFAQTGKPNNWAYFDAGAAWMSIAVQAAEMGLYTHCMAGFKEKEAAELLGVNLETHGIAAAVAAGYIGEKSQLPENLAEMEQPNDRKELSQIRWQPTGN